MRLPFLVKGGCRSDPHDELSKKSNSSYTPLQLHDITQKSAMFRHCTRECSTVSWFSEHLGLGDASTTLEFILNWQCFEVTLPHRGSLEIFHGRSYPEILPTNSSSLWNNFPENVITWRCTNTEWTPWNLPCKRGPTQTRRPKEKKKL